MKVMEKVKEEPILFDKATQNADCFSLTKFLWDGTVFTEREVLELWRKPNLRNA